MKNKTAAGALYRVRLTKIADGGSAFRSGFHDGPFEWISADTIWLDHEGLQELMRPRDGGDLTIEADQPVEKLSIEDLIALAAHRWTSNQTLEQYVAEEQARFLEESRAAAI